MRRWVGPIIGGSLLIALLALAWWAYHPGLTGDFLFDDFPNLSALGATGPVDNWAAFWRYITSGFADPTGRPLALLSFLIDAHNWPAKPYPFKVTGVILHLINGALLFCVLWRLGRALLPRGHRYSDHTPVGAAEAANPSGLPALLHVGASEAANPSGLPALLHVGAAAAATSGLPAMEPSAMDGIPATSRQPLSGLPALLHAGAAAAATSGHPAMEPSAMDGIPATSRQPLSGLPALLPIGAAEAATSGLPASTSVGAAAAATRENLVPAFAALFGAGAWLLHPLFVSTTLYIVQREAMLPATFVLIGMLGWMASRSALARGHRLRAWTGMALSAWGCTALAVLSKANGALLPVLLLLVEWIVLARQPSPDASARHRQRHATVVFLLVPAALVLAYLLYLLPPAIAGAPAARGWTVGERLLTESRVVTDYLRLLVIPHADSSGLFNDEFPVSTGWLHPASTLPCVLLILALIGAGFALRRKHPAIALALLFYLAAQLMESGWIALELYYEHRNYLPAMLLFWPIGLGLARLRHLCWPAVAVAACILLSLATLTRQRATLWGDGMRLAQTWAAMNPDSARAQANAALYDMARGRPRLAAARLRLSLPKHPDDIQAPVNLIGAECQLGAVQPGTVATVEHALAHTRLGGEAAFKWFNQALTLASQHTCTGLDFAALQAVLDAARRNPYWRDIYGRQQDIDHMQGQLDLAQGHAEKALTSFNRALGTAPNPGVALQQAAYLGSHGYPALGLAHLDYFATLPPPAKPGFGMPRIHAWVLHEQNWWPNEITRLRHTLAADAARHAASTSK